MTPNSRSLDLVLAIQEKGVMPAPDRADYGLEEPSMSDQEVMAEPLALGKVEIIILALAIQAKGKMPTLEEIGEASFALGFPRWTKRGHPSWVQHLYQRGLAKDGRITVEGRSCLHRALFKQDLPAELVGWAKNTIGDDDV